MKNNTGIATKIKHFYSLFDKRTYETFKIVINGILCLKNWKQGDLANLGEKTLGQVQYFFSKSRWNYELLNTLRIQWIRNKIGGARDKLSDILIFDATIFAKNKASNFKGLTDYFFSNRDRKVVNGIELFGASIITDSGFKYILDIEIFSKIKSLNLLENRGDSEINSAWRTFMNTTIKKTKAWLIVLDSGFKGAEMCKNILENCKRHFLVRISAEQIFYDQNGKRCKISELLQKKNAMYFPNGRMWVFKGVYLQSWNNKGFKTKVNIIVFHKNGPKNPSVLVTSAEIEDVYESMIRKKGDKSFKEKLKENSGTFSIPSEEDRIYYCFVSLYKRRWTIEECFKELKSYLCFESFQVQSHEAIIKYLHVILLVHSLIYIMLSSLTLKRKDFNFVYDFLKEKRNIKNDNGGFKRITLMGLKLFIEMMFQLGGSGNLKGKSKKKIKNILKVSISLKSVSFDNLALS